MTVVFGLGPENDTAPDVDNTSSNMSFLMRRSVGDAAFHDIFRAMQRLTT
jgi:hypothetical protein